MPKKEHKVHLGWYHFDEGKKMYVHVRAKAGGGKRTVMLNRSLIKQSFIKEYLNLFFSDGESQQGFPTETEHEETTLGDIIDKAKLQFVHFYLGEATVTPTIPIIPIVRKPNKFSFVVHRGQVLRELIKIFKENSDVDFKKDIILASIILPNREREQAYESGGVMRDMLSEFWEDFYEQCTTGTDLSIPCLRHDMEVDDWRAVGKIIALGCILQKLLPFRLAPNFLKSFLFGIGSDKLREEFLQFIPKSESGILSNAIGDMEKADMYELLEILSIHDCKVKITKDNIGPVID